MLNGLIKRILEGWVEATGENFTDHPLATTLRHDLKNEINDFLLKNEIEFNVKASAGAGNWANVPWLSILDPNKTSTTQEGIYPVYLFRADGSGFYLSLGFGTTKLKKLHGAVGAKKEAVRIANRIQQLVPEIQHLAGRTIDLKASTDLGKSYEWGSAGAIFYDVNNIPLDEVLKKDLLDLINIYNRIPTAIMTNIQEDEKVIGIINDMAVVTKLPKPFILLAGLSGTGKSRFVREQAKSSGRISETYCLVAVRPDWHEPSDLLGYTSRLNGKAEYVTTDVLQFIARAWMAMIDAGLSVVGKNIDGQGERLVVEGDEAALNGLLPHWLCLDEMNLAPVEQYFADYLSILETREWRWDDTHFEYLCDPILKSATINQLTDPNIFRVELGIADNQYDVLWQLFCDHGIGVPLNLIVAGTVNMDETTHGFSRKVIDRALSFDFGEFYPIVFADYFSPSTRNKTLSYPIWSATKTGQLPGIDSDGQKSIAFLDAINQVLDNTPFKLAFRALNELFLAVVSAQPKNDIELNAVWDDFLMCKLLPRIEGDSDKLANESIEQSLLVKLSEILKIQLASIWDGFDGDANARPDLFREKDDGSVITISCRSKKKIDWMQNRLTQSGFTSFWP